MQAAAGARAQYVGHQVAGAEEGVVVVAHGPGHVHLAVGHRPPHPQLAGCGLLRLGRQGLCLDRLPGGHRPEGLPRLAQLLVVRQRGRYGQHRARRTVPAVVEGLHVGQRGLGHMAYVGPYGGPAVGMHLVAQRTQQQPHVAVGLVHVALAVLLGHHVLLHLEGALCDVEARHAVGLQHQGRLQVAGRQGDVVVGIVAVGGSVALASDAAQHPVEVGHALRAAEHQVLEEVGEARAAGVLVARPDAVQQVHRRQRRVPRLVRQHRQPVV